MFMFKFLKKLTRLTIEKSLLRKRGVVQYYNDSGKDAVFDLIRDIKKEIDFRMSYTEAYQLYKIVGAAEKVKGEIAEVGVYMGGSAKIICEAKGRKPLYLFDTFEGLPEVGKKDSSGQFYKSKFTTPFSEVKKYLSNYPNVYFYKGFFPETADAIKDKKFSLIHLDVDLYGSTLTSLQFFYPRMSKGGVIVSHDYSYVPGVKQAFDEFFQDKPEAIIELVDTQCLVVKL